MVLKLLYPLVKYITFFNVFQYITFRAAYAAVTALLISFLFGPRIIRKLRELKVGQKIRHDGPETHLSKSGTPTMGGILIIISVVVAVLLWQNLDNTYTWIILLAVVGFGGIGFVDDYLKIKRKNAAGLTSGFKWITQFVLSLAIALLIFTFRNYHTLTLSPPLFNGMKMMVKYDYTTLLYIPFLKNPVLDFSFFYIPFSVLLLLSTSNAVNLTDGLDGLATGLIIMVGITFAIMAYLTGNIRFAEYLGIPFVNNSGELTIAGMALVGACVGFLWFNAHPAEIMMGDTGSLSLGGLIGVFALILKKEVLIIVIGGVFVLETLSVIIQVLYYKFTKKRVFLMAPLHHHFELKGWKESKVVTRFWILGGLFALLGLSTLKIQ
ncbi:MAG: phospho-N-acetylmuramoyl-pentapeptide-transferase [Spirochaetia bacterium]